MFNEFATAEELVSAMILRGDLSPAAAEMDPEQVIDQLYEAEGRTPGDGVFRSAPERAARAYRELGQHLY